MLREVDVFMLLYDKHKHENMHAAAAVLSVACYCSQNKSGHFLYAKLLIHYMGQELSSNDRFASVLLR